MTAAEFLIGLGFFAAALAPMMWGAVRLRARLTPRWKGAQARLVESVLTLGGIIAVSEALGSFGAFRRIPLVLGCAGVGAAVGITARARNAAAAEEDTAPPRPAPPRWVGVIALLIVATLVGQWVQGTAAAVSHGITQQDSLTYHLPHAARFFQQGWTSRIQYTDTDFPDAFHPSHNEILQAFGMVVFRRDLLAPVLNLLWLALTLLAAWCVGSRRGWGAIALASGALILASPLVIVENAGAASNDLPVIFFFLAAVAFLLSEDRDRVATALAGMACGLAIGTKLTPMFIVAALTIGIVFIAQRGRRRREIVAWVLPLVLAGGYWYVRNQIRVGSPTPALRLGAGLLPFTTPHFKLVDRFGYSVAHYLGDTSVWHRWFLPGLRRDFGPAWWLTLGLAAAGVLITLLRRGSPLLRTLGAVAFIGAATYVITPTTALGAPGRPLLFATNVIYLTPALALGLVLLTQEPSARAGARAQILFLVIAAAFVASQFAHLSWPKPLRLWGIVGGGAALIAGALALRLASMEERRRRTLAAICVGVLLAGAAVGSYPLARRYLSRSFTSDRRWSWARELAGKRIAVAGFGPQYPLYGRTLSNYVQYVGHARPNGEFVEAQSCEEWRRALRAGRFTYVVLRPERLFTDVVHREIPWTMSDPAASGFLSLPGEVVFRFDPSVPDPGCPGP